ncbi:diguanylate cyclase/phosphodiesterase (GGDEF & EAL domains) with PAS/PAC sensor(s) [Pseudoalteromonas luteoviolacea B = ATCC 29581]|nr:diguanylate cyclase/phosphodiesterase (GGDEF & EAL domains) with PAS/PAC sensor(s) [Pseudoalteromonas luteoviolacea B = ATCC 29581]
MGSLIALINVVSAAPSGYVHWIQTGSLQACFAGAVLMGLIVTLLLPHRFVTKSLNALMCLVGLAIISVNLITFSFLLFAIIGAQLFIGYRAKQRALSIVYIVNLFIVAVLITLYFQSQLPLFWLSIPVLISLMAHFSFEGDHARQSTPGKTVLGREVDPLGVADKESLRQAFLNFKLAEPVPAVLVLLRLEGFQDINLHLGRDYGDMLLVQSANRLRQQLRNPEVISIACAQGYEKVAHLGGLNFVFICRLDIHKHLHEQLLDDVLSNTLKPFNVANCTLEIKARASYVSCDEADGDFDQILNCAFLALDGNPNKTISAYEPQLKTQKQEQQARLGELVHANFRNEFELYFQPVIRHSDGGIEFLELLLRWQHPKQGILSANVFIEEIRLSGLAFSVAQFVIERAAEIALALKMENQAIPLSINVFGPEMLHEEFIEFIDSVLSEHQLPSGSLIIECPAALFLSLTPQEVAMIARLKSLGIKLCVDGFGEAPLVLAKLTKLSVDYVKIGKSLTSEHQQQGQFRAMVKGMVEMQQQLNSKVLCEGVETLEQLNFTKSLNTYGAQGYYFARPLSSVGMITWLKQWHVEHPVSDFDLPGL